MTALAARCELGGGARQHSRFNNCGEGLLWHRSLSRGRARGQRRACEIDLRRARPAPAACAALCVAMDGRRRPASMVCWWRSDGGEDSAPRPPQQRATSTTLAATRRHRCRHGMAAADCTGFARAPKSVVAPAALNDHQNLAALIIFAALYARTRRWDADDGTGGAMRARGRRATATNKAIANPTALPKALHKEFDSNERLRVSNWIVQRLYYYAVK